MSFDTDTIFQLPEIDIKNVDCVYSGKPGQCRCGCAGNYAYTVHNMEWSGKHRGYAIDPEDVNNARVKAVINKMRKYQHLGIEVLKNYIFSLQIGKTEYSIYLKTEND